MHQPTAYTTSTHWCKAGDPIWSACKNFFAKSKANLNIKWHYHDFVLPIHVVFALPDLPSHSNRPGQARRQPTRLPSTTTSAIFIQQQKHFPKIVWNKHENAFVCGKISKCGGRFRTELFHLNGPASQHIGILSLYGINEFPNYSTAELKH